MRGFLTGLGAAAAIFFSVQCPVRAEVFAPLFELGGTIDHPLTTSCVERDAIYKKQYQYIGALGSVHTAASPGVIHLRRFVGGGFHVYRADPKGVQNLQRLKFKEEVSNIYVSENSTPETIPLVEFYNDKSWDRFYATDPDDPRGSVAKGYEKTIVGYIWPEHHDQCPALQQVRFAYCACAQGQGFVQAVTKWVNGQGGLPPGAAFGMQGWGCTSVENRTCYDVLKGGACPSPDFPQKYTQVTVPNSNRCPFR